MNQPAARRMTTSSLMPGFMRTAVIGSIFLALNFFAISSIAIAKNYHRHHHSMVSTTAKGFDPQVQAAQTHLVNLNYFDGPADGVLGPNTKAAIKKFQAAEHFPVTGKLTVQTFAQLEQEDSSSPKTNSSLTVSSTTTKTAVTAPPKPDFYATHPDAYGYVQQQFAEPMKTPPLPAAGTPAADGNTNDGHTQTIPSRYGKIEMTEASQGGGKNYNVTFNGQPLLQADGQASVIGVSRTYNLATEDAIVFTTYNNQNLACPYKSYVATFQADHNAVQEIKNCTNGYQVKMANNSLFIIFPEAETGRDVGATWRYDNGSLERL
jgi:peptidoglycan hydrolase-like protein with peptidoglycan-binding domain